MKKVIVFIVAIALFVLLASITGSDRNIAFSAPGLLLVAITTTVCLGAKTNNVFEPIKWVAALYGMAFGAFPMLLDPPELAQYTKSSIHVMQWYLLVCFCLFLAGYKLWQAVFPVKNRARASQHPISSDSSSVTWVAGVIFLLGFFGYIYAIVKSGGIAYFLAFRGPRPELFENVHGLFYRLSLWMLSGFALYAAATIRKRPITMGICAVCLGMAYFLFMGRGLAISPIVIFMVLYHYQVKRVKARYVTVGLIAGVFLVGIAGVIRSAGKNRENLLQNPIEFLQGYMEYAGDSVERLLLNYVEHLDTLMLINAHLDEGEPLLKGSTLTMWFEPIDRLVFGNKLVGSVSAGHFVAVLRDPRFKKKAFGQWPTLVGEFALNFGLIGAGVCMLLYGACIQMISRPLQVGTISLTAMAMHPYVFYIFTRATLSGSSHFLNVLIVIFPLLIASIVFSNHSCQIKTNVEASSLGTLYPRATSTRYLETR